MATHVVKQTGVSVIIPTNRGGPYLRQAVESVRRQTVPVEQIILVDDGSPEPGLSAVADELGLTYVRQPASGISTARNTGVEAASGHWIAFLDDDDVWHPERIEAQLRKLDTVSGAVGSHTGGWFMDADGVRFGEDWGAPQGTASDYISVRVVPPRITTVLVRRDAYREVGGCDPAMEPAEDNELILRLLLTGPFAAVDRPLVGYRRHTANVTNRGLKGRQASVRALRVAHQRATADGDLRVTELLRVRKRIVLRHWASENLGELISALRLHDWAYAARLARWALADAPLESLHALADRISRRLRR